MKPKQNKQETPSWHEYFMGMAKYAATKSKDRSTKVGAVLVSDNNRVLGIGFNGFPRGVNDNVEVRHDRPLKYLITEHAERNCIYSAACHGVKTGGTKIYISGNGLPCADCARAIIQSGVTEVITFMGKFEGKGSQWEESIKASEMMLQEAGIKLTLLDKNFEVAAIRWRAKR